MTDTPQAQGAAPLSDNLAKRLRLKGLRLAQRGLPPHEADFDEMHDLASEAADRIDKLQAQLARPCAWCGHKDSDSIAKAAADEEICPVCNGQCKQQGRHA